MSRGRSNKHVVREDLGEGETYRYVAWCGDRASSLFCTAKDEDDPSACRKCIATLYADKGPSRFRLGDGLDQPAMAALGRKWDYRYAYPVYDDRDDQWGWLVMAGGFGSAWKFVVWSSGLSLADAERGNPPNPVMGWELPRKIGGDYAMEFKAKEEFLWKFPALITERDLKNKTATIAHATAWGERVRTNE
jgi:hypothetical protein